MIAYKKSENLHVFLFLFKYWHNVSFHIVLWNSLFTKAYEKISVMIQIVLILLWVSAPVENIS